MAEKGLDRVAPKIDWITAYTHWQPKIQIITS
jgi:hypothetical protein